MKGLGIYGLIAHGLPTRAIFLVAAAAFIVRVWMVLGPSRERNAARLRSRAGRRRSRWLASRGFALLAAAGLVLCVLASAVAARHWIRYSRGARIQKSLTLDLHIPNVSPDQTYTVTAKFGVDGRPYVTRSPLHVKFGAQRPVYHVTLYYDPKNPARNAWTPLQPPGRSASDRILLSATGSMIFTMLLLTWFDDHRFRVRGGRADDDSIPADHSDAASTTKT